MERPHEIDSFESYIENGKVEEKSKDPGRAEGLRSRSISKFKVMESLGIDEDSSTDYLENVYESCKMLVLSFMAENGYKPYSHEAIIAYAADNLGLDMVDINTFNRYRKLRNDLVYRGDKTTVEEAKDMRRFYRDLQSELLEK